MTVRVAASFGATSRQVMCDWGAPCNSRMGGPEPPITPLISAPVVFTRNGLKPGNHLVVSPAGVCANAEGALRLEATPSAVTCIVQSRRFMSVIAGES
jgi:hypothetical protein